MRRQKQSKRTSVVIAGGLIESRILLVRARKVICDTDLANLYGVETFNLNKAVKRNRERFPSDFMFQLTRQEAEALTFQIGMSKTSGRGGRRTLPYVFTEQGVAMLSSVLNTERAVKVNVAIMRVFVRLREVLRSDHDLAVRMDQLEKKLKEQGATIAQVFASIRQLMTPDQKRKIGF
jgi:uncharacterized membrane-anchored protein YjiN (DUF445 family)